MIRSFGRILIAENFLGNDQKTIVAKSLGGQAGYCAHFPVWCLLRLCVLCVEC